MNNEPASESNGAVVTADFVRHRNVLLLQADMGPLFVDYYLHLADNGIRHAPGQDAASRRARRIGHESNVAPSAKRSNRPALAAPP